MRLNEDDRSGDEEDRSREDSGGRPSNRAFLIGLVVIVVLAIAGILIVEALIDNVRLQDCAITGRTNC